MKNRIIISIKELNKSNWGLIYQFIKRFYDNSSIDNDTFNKLKVIDDKTKEPIAVLKISDKVLDKDVYSVYGNNLQIDTQLNITETTFAILYQKQNTSKDFTNIVPFYFLHKEFQGKVTLGINLNCFSDATLLPDFTFPCRTFLKIFKDAKPTNGENTVYFINEKNLDRKTGEIIPFAKPTIATFRNPDDKNISRYILPLTIIDKNLFYPLFRANDYENETVKDFIIAIDKQDETINDSRLLPRTDEKAKILFRSIFEEWFIKAYFVSSKKTNTNKIRLDNAKDKENYIDNTNFFGLINLLKSYCENIKELVENIIIHTDDKKGLMYIVFQKKENLTQNQQNSISGIDSYNDLDRFVEIGIMDFNEKGILDTYKQTSESTEKPQFLDFFDTKKIHTTGLDHLYLRYAAHLGIKTFANAVKNHSGSFYVESNNNSTKEAIKYYLGKLPNEIQTLPYCCNGTHYEIIFPVKQINNYKYSHDNYKTIIQYKSISNYLQNYLKADLPVFTDINFNQILKKIDSSIFVNISSKEEQNRLITTVGDLILQESTANSKKTLVLNTKQTKSKNEISSLFKLFINDSNLFFKLLAYLQLREHIIFKRIILTHLPNLLTDNLCEQINNLLINSGTEPVWSNDIAIILISDNLRYQIICGETKNEIAYINAMINSYYFNKNSFDISYNVNQIAKITREKLEDFVLPYEFLIKTENEIDFKQYTSDILENPIEAENIGCKVSHKNSRIGSKIITENYYEADFLFQNNFFVDRFAYFAAKEIIKNYEDKKIENKIALIGYNPYSELLIKKIQFYVNSHCKDKISTVIIAREENNDLIFKFDATHKIDFENKPNCEKLSAYKYITIVPIASTLTTNDKIIALFKQKTGLQEVDFIYNHCTILVRDRMLKNNGITKIEKQQKWISKTGNTINTYFDNAKEINFLIEKEGIWHFLINTEVSFRDKYWKEIPINQTQNASLNSQNLFSYPNVAIPKEYQNNREAFYLLTKKRLSEIKEYIYFGHIESNKNHHRYYIDTEEFARSGNDSLNKWVKQLKKENVFQENTSHILITPDINIESDFINLINKELFNDSALVLYIDIDKWRNNVKDKFSFLQAINENNTKPKFHFIDHALLTASSYKKAKSYILSILSSNHRENITFKFDSVITLINRLSYDRNKEISEAENTQIYSFTHLFIPPSKDPEKDCSLCDLINHYDKLKERSVLDGCRTVIDKNKSRIASKPFNRYTNNGDAEQKIKIDKITDKNRYFVRMEMKHHLFFEISNIVKEFDGKIQTEKEIKTINRKLLRRLTELYNECCNDIDSKISFLKNISSPPLSHYIKMRYYAHRKLLVELHKLLTDSKRTDKYLNYNDFRTLKVILKQLSMLGSNALVRKEVIIGAWELYFKVRLQISQEKNSVYKLKAKTENRLHKLIKNQNNAEMGDMFSQKQQELQKHCQDLQQQYEDLKEKKKKCGEFNSDFQFFIKNTIFDDEAKSLYLGELLRTGNEIKSKDIKNNTVKINTTVLENSIYANFKDKSKNFRNEYLRFLLWTFYDNTTIIRRTLENFEKELQKIPGLKQNFQTQDFDSFCGQVNNIKTKLRATIGTQYYYSSIEKYINQTAAYGETGNPDEIDFVEKLIYVLYAKLKLKKINANLKQDTNTERLENIAQALLQVFAKIMGASAAFFSIKHQNGETKNTSIHTLAVHNLLNYDINLNNEPYYTSDVLFEKGTFNNNIMFPLLIKETLENKHQEKKLLGYNNLACLVLNNPQSKCSEDNPENTTDVIGSITFLYKTEDKFKVRSQEYGRLLLLLKPEFNEYIKHILSEKTVDLWVEKEEKIGLYESKFDKFNHNAERYIAEKTKIVREQENNKLPLFAINQIVFGQVYIGNYYANYIKKIKQRQEIPEIAKSKEYGSSKFTDPEKQWLDNFFEGLKTIYSGSFDKGGIFVKYTFEISDYNDFTTKIKFKEIKVILIELVSNALEYEQGINNKINIQFESDQIVFKSKTINILTAEKVKELNASIKNKSLNGGIGLFMINKIINSALNKNIEIHFNNGEFKVIIPGN